VVLYGAGWLLLHSFWRLSPRAFRTVDKGLGYAYVGWVRINGLLNRGIGVVLTIVALIGLVEHGIDYLKGAPVQQLRLGIGVLTLCLILGVAMTAMGQWQLKRSRKLQP